MTEERCVVCDEPTGRAGRDDDSLYCGECDLGPLCQEHYDAHIVMVRALYPEPLGQKVEGTMIPLLEEQDWQSNEGIARRLNDVIVAVNALDARLRRVEAREGGQAADGENMCPKCGGSGMIYCGWGEAEYCECRRDWKKEYEDAEEAIGGLVDERDELRAERDEALARVAELEE